MRKMRRTKNEITDQKEILELIQKGQVVRVGMVDDGMAYIVPMNYGFKDNTFYFHCAKEGRKIDIIKKNNKVCFEIDEVVDLVDAGDEACKWTMKYKSIMGTGVMSVVEDYDEKVEGLNILMNHYSGRESFDYVESMVKRVNILKLSVESVSGKKSI